MYSILLVEDEKLELETLRDYVEWEKLGIGPVYTAMNGKRALECVEEYNPDIVITDVQMPVMDGIGLARTLAERKYPCKIVFLTGYDDFEYIKTAFQVRAVDYLLKPFTIEEVERCIEKVKEELEKEKIQDWSKKMAAAQVFQAAIQGSVPKEKLREYCQGLFECGNSGLHFGAGAVYGRFSDEELNQVKQAYQEILYAEQEERMAVFLLRPYAASKDATARIEGFLGKLCGRRFVALYSVRQWEIGELQKIVGDFQKNSGFAFYQRTGEVFALESIEQEKTVFGGEIDRNERRQKTEELCGALGRADERQVIQKMRECLEPLAGYGTETCIREVYTIYLYVRNRLVSEDEALELWMKEGEAVSEDGINRVENYEQLENWLKAFLEKILAYFVKQKENPNYHVVVSAREYLRLHYREPLEIEVLARKAGLSPNYLRSVFKEITGKTILEYIIEIRLEKAAELLKNKSMKIKEISAAVGYDNVSYFGTLFQKKYGATPNEYRKMV